MGPKEILCFSFVPGVMSYNPGVFPRCVRVTALEFSREQGKPPKKRFLLETQDIHGVQDLTFSVEGHGIGSAVKLQLRREFSPCLNKERTGHNIPQGAEGLLKGGLKD